jgi:hypothetical protein
MGEGLLGCGGKGGVIESKVKTSTEPCGLKIATSKSSETRFPDASRVNWFTSWNVQEVRFELTPEISGFKADG